MIVSGFSFTDATLTPTADTTLIVLGFALESAGATGVTFYDFVEINACGVVPPTEPDDCLAATSGSVQVDTVVPVELTAFDGLADGGAIVLSWTTASETTNAGFEVQQRVDGHFQSVAFVPGAGTTLQPQRYTHRIGGLGPGRHTFRLKQIDYDGTATTYGPLVVALAPARALHASRAYPNPFNPSTRLLLAVSQTQPVRVTAHDLLGRQVAVVFEGVVSAEAPRRVTFDASGLPSGQYVLQIQGATYREMQRVVLSK